MNQCSGQSMLMLCTLQMEAVGSFLSGIFNEDDTSKLLQHLSSIGAESMDDLLNLRVDMDVSDEVLPVLKRRRLNCNLEKMKQPLHGEPLAYFYLCL